jgi:hypothetical protein
MHECGDQTQSYRRMQRAVNRRTSGDARMSAAQPIHADLPAGHTVRRDAVSPRIHHARTMDLPCIHRVRTTGLPCIHRVRTTGLPCFHHARTMGSPCARGKHTVCLRCFHVARSRIRRMNGCGDRSFTVAAQ